MPAGRTGHFRREGLAHRGGYAATDRVREKCAQLLVGLPSEQVLPALQLVLLLAECILLLPKRVLLPPKRSLPVAELTGGWPATSTSSSAGGSCMTSPGVISARAVS